MHACSLFGGDLLELGLGDGDDVIHLAAVGGGLVSGGLQQAGLQGQQRLRILHRQRGKAGFGRVAEAGLDDLQIERGELLDAFERLGGEAQHNFEVGLVGGGELFGIQHGVLQWKQRVVLKQFAALQHDSSLLDGAGNASSFCCFAANLVRRF